MFKLFGFFLSFGIFTAAVFFGGSVLEFINVPSLAIVFFGTFGLLSFKYGKEGFTYLFDKNRPHHYNQYGGYYAVASGWLGSLIGWIQMAHYISDWSAPVVGVSFGVSALTILYGYLLKVFVFSPGFEYENPSSGYQEGNHHQKSAA
jgi:flagellar motor component MotA